MSEINISRGFSNVPNYLTTYFTGREDVLAKIRQSYKNENSSSRLAGFTTLWGMGGIGKTQVALEYCRQEQSSGCKSVFWVDGYNLQKGWTSISTLTRSLCYNYVLSNAFDVAEGILSSLQEPWILVIDNLESYDSIPLERLKILGRHGSILLTSCLPPPTIYNINHAIEITGLSMTEGENLLSQVMDSAHINHINQDKHAIAQIVSAMGGHPLALAHVGGLIRAGSIHINQFLSHYERQKHKLFASRSPNGHYGKTLDSVLDLSIKALDEDGSDGFARGLLTLLAFLDPDDIPTQLFYVFSRAFKNLANPNEYERPAPSAPPEVIGSSKSPIQSLVSQLELNWDDFIFESNLSVLSSHSLINVSKSPSRKDGRAQISIHRVIREFLRGSLSEKEAKSYTVLASKIIKVNIEAILEDQNISLPRSQNLGHQVLAIEQIRLQLWPPGDTRRLSQGNSLDAADKIFASHLNNLGLFEVATKITRRIIDFNRENTGFDYLRFLLSIQELVEQ